MKTNLAMKMDLSCKRQETGQISAPCAVDRLKTRPMDVLSLKGCSETGLYVLQRGGAKPLCKDEKTSGAKLLARTRGLSKEEKQDLQEQNIEIAWLRETGIDNLLPLSSEKYEGKETTWGTEVVPYIVVSEVQAKSIQSMAGEIPRKEVKEQLPRVPLNLPQEALNHLGWCIINGGV